MSLNKFTNTQKGLDLELKIGCETLIAENMYIDKVIEEDMTSATPIGVLENSTYTQGQDILTLASGGSVDYPTFNISEGCVIETDFTFPMGIDGLLHRILCGQTENFENNQHTVDYEPDGGADNLSIASSIDGSPSLIQATAPNDLTSLRITYTKSPANMLIEGREGLNDYVTYLDTPLTTADITSGVKFVSQGSPDAQTSWTNISLDGNQKVLTEGDLTELQTNVESGSYTPVSASLTPLGTITTLNDMHYILVGDIMNFNGTCVITLPSSGTYTSFAIDLPPGFNGVVDTCSIAASGTNTTSGLTSDQVVSVTSATSGNLVDMLLGLNNGVDFSVATTDVKVVFNGQVKVTRV